MPSLQTNLISPQIAYMWNKTRNTHFNKHLLALELAQINLYRKAYLNTAVVEPWCIDGNPTNQNQADLELCSSL